MKRRNRCIEVLVLFIMLITSIVSLADGESEGVLPEWSYEDMKNSVRINAGLEDDISVPYPEFSVSANGKVLGYGRTGPVAYDLITNPRADRLIEPIATVPVGTKITLRAISMPGVAGANMVNHDWQSAYRTPENEAYPGSYDVKIQQSNVYSRVADKPGYMLFYLNAMDDQKWIDKRTGGYVSYSNWSDRGSRRVPGRTGQQPGQRRIYEWFYTPVKIKVIEAGDLGMKAPIKMYKDGVEVSYVEASEDHTFTFNIEHLKGLIPVGEPVEYLQDNPKDKINVTITDGAKKKQTETIQLDKVLYPGEEATFRPTKPFDSQTGIIKVCAVIDPIHKELGLNKDISNDAICHEFSMVKNYSMKKFYTTPGSITLGENDGNSVKTPVSFEFDIGHEDLASDGELQPRPNIEIRQNGKLIWSGARYVNGNSVTRFSETIMTTLNKGPNRFTVEVNPAPRKEVEMKPGMSNPYSDNIKAFTLNVGEPVECMDCETKNKKNTWTEEFRWNERYNCRSRRRKDGSSSCRYSRRSWEGEYKFRESFEIENIYIRSKCGSI